jgi:peptidoglycan hydrolase-like protein with peptidoglycan-binding domain
VQTELDQARARPHLRVDGSFGPLTLESVENFQRSKRLPVDGVVGPQTARDLDNALRKNPSSKQTGVKVSNTGSSASVFGFTESSLGQHVPLTALLIAGFLAALIIVFRFARHAFTHQDVKSVRVRIRGFTEVEVVKHTPERELRTRLGTAYLNAYAQSQQPLALPDDFTPAIDSGDYYEQR